MFLVLIEHVHRPGFERKDLTGRHVLDLGPLVVLEVEQAGPRAVRLIPPAVDEDLPRALG